MVHEEKQSTAEKHLSSTHVGKVEERLIHKDQENFYRNREIIGKQGADILARDFDKEIKDFKEKI